MTTAANNPTISGAAMPIERVPRRVLEIAADAFCLDGLAHDDLVQQFADDWNRVARQASQMIELLPANRASYEQQLERAQAQICRELIGGLGAERVRLVLRQLAEVVAAEGEMLDDDSEFTCWCGVTGKVGEMFDDSGLDETCGGTGELYCFCGGDLCVCHHHGATDCPGCEECERQDDVDDMGDEPWEGSDGWDNDPR